MRFLQLEQGESVDMNEIVGIFDIDTAGSSKEARALFSRKESEFGVISLSSDLPKSFVLCDNEFGDRIYISGLSTETVKRRIKN
ncbi:MAG: DUF370 domain-containing protein [Clostridia bacterium]|nr:DUF370 domain-containing protein [Clostridia bacterium]